MAKNLSIKTVIEKNRIASDEPFLLMLLIHVRDATTGKVEETIRIVRNNEDVMYQGRLYSAFPFEISIRMESGGTPTMTVTAQDFTRAIQARLQAYGGAVGSEAELMVVNAGNLEQPPEVIEYFQVNHTSSADYTVTFDLGADDFLSKPFPSRRQMKDYCGWEYKSAECGYTGSLETCDLTLQGDNGCARHRNTINYGGMPGLQSNGVRYV